MSTETPSLVITGSSSGIGLAFLNLAAGLYRPIVSLGRTDPGKFNEQHTHLNLDLKLSVTRQLQDFQTPKMIDCLVLCAGSDLGGRSDFLSRDFNLWEETINVNFLRTLELIQFLLPKVLASKKKTILGITSTNIDHPAKGCLAYTAAKTAFRSCLEGLRLEYGGRGLRVIEVCPGLTKTDFAFNRLKNRSQADQFYAGFSSILSPQDVAQSMLNSLNQSDGVVISRLEIQPSILVI